jgi:hypothetical protein
MATTVYCGPFFSVKFNILAYINIIMEMNLTEDLFSDSKIQFAL